MALNHFHKYLYHEILRILIYEMKQGEASLGGAASASRWTSVLPLLRSTVATWAQDKERFGEVSGFVGVMPSWDLEAANMDAWALSGTSGRPHKGSALAGRRGDVSSDSTAWNGHPP